MIGEGRLKEVARKLFSVGGADQLEAVMSAGALSLTRFANNQIHQNVTEENVQVTVRAVLKNRIGVAKVNTIEDESLKWAVERAIDAAKCATENRNLKTLPAPEAYHSVRGHFASIEKASPEWRAESVRKVVEPVIRRGLTAAGALSVHESELAVFNSLGVKAYHPSTWIRLTTVVSSEDSSGYSQFMGPDLDQLKPIDVAEEAITKCLKGRHPVEIEPGRYDVFLEEYALSEIFGWLSWIGMGARSLQEGKSFMTHRIGDKIMDEKVTIWDDGNDPHTCALPFDFEGVPRKKVMIIEKGVARGVVYDTITAAKEEKSSTGHALPPDLSLFGPLPLHLHMAAGMESKSSIVSSIEKGIWVTRFHYINGLLKPREALFTGMTRDGTFLIENGKSTVPLKNLRFTESMLRAFSNVVAVSQEKKVVGTEESDTSIVPAVWIKDFNFTGKTQF
jgi:predicted Zn-dependent protease